ncbi:hypothetical protein SARC_11158 [Sphaeroforma arctica JP610]|uniref:C2H2-type domain-containing protein n=1 Tax=Sphaeroforma arctica JP610 TaxID=667725 RepID=A0A0L0FHV4_9EUKA|nr:hypothetical protein SARC_11158 [Sphaeroforma arctica JP610]KNC76340.1 hypothetical protein SARC_11158 [Sphaeroforma arctica JP610]|eukprot:XP_014150242.1 hypothetical protein SARC_11158 [Sphaeroforma arctica JP610]
MQYHSEPMRVMRADHAPASIRSFDISQTNTITREEHSLGNDKEEAKQGFGSKNSTQGGSHSCASYKSFSRNQADSMEVDANGSTSSGAGSQRRQTVKPEQTCTRTRRSISQLSRPFVCMYDRCGRAYTTKQARQLHYRLKHTQGSVFCELAAPVSTGSSLSSASHKQIKSAPIYRKFPVGSSIRNNLPASPQPVRDFSVSNAVGGDTGIISHNNTLTKSRLSEFNASQSGIAAKVDYSQHPLRQGFSSSSSPTVQGQGEKRQSFEGDKCDNSGESVVVSNLALRCKRMKMSSGDVTEEHHKIDHLLQQSDTPGLMLKLPTKTLRKEHPHIKRKKGYVSKKKRQQRIREKCPVHGTQHPPCVQACCRVATVPAGPPSMNSQTHAGIYDVGYGQHVVSTQSSSTMQNNEEQNYGPVPLYLQDTSVASNPYVASRYSAFVQSSCTVHMHREQIPYSQAPVMWVPFNQHIHQVAGGNYIAIPAHYTDMHNNAMYEH